MTVTATGAHDFKFSIDRGGTFTDVYAEFLDAGGKQQQRVLKLLSVDPANYPDAPREGIRRVLEVETGKPHPRDVPVDTSLISSIRMGTTVRRRIFRLIKAPMAGRDAVLPVGGTGWGLELGPPGRWPARLGRAVRRVGRHPLRAPTPTPVRYEALGAPESMLHDMAHSLQEPHPRDPRRWLRTRCWSARASAPRS